MPDPITGFYDSVTERKTKDFSPKIWDWSTADPPDIFAIIGPRFQSQYNIINDAFYNHWRYGVRKAITVGGHAMNAKPTFAETQKQFNQAKGQLYSFLAEELYERLVIEHGDPGRSPPKGDSRWDTADDATIEFWRKQIKRDEAFDSRIKSRDEDGINVRP